MRIILWPHDVESTVDLYPGKKIEVIERFNIEGAILVETDENNFIDKSSDQLERLRES